MNKRYQRKKIPIVLENKWLEMTVKENAPASVKLTGLWSDWCPQSPHSSILNCSSHKHLALFSPPLCSQYSLWTEHPFLPTQWLEVWRFPKFESYISDDAVYMSIFKEAFPELLSWKQSLLQGPVGPSMLLLRHSHLCMMQCLFMYISDLSGFLNTDVLQRSLLDPFLLSVYTVA